MKSVNATIDRTDSMCYNMNQYDSICWEGINMAKRFMISVNDDFYSWLANEAESIGIPSATLATILLNEAKKARDAQAGAQIASERMKENFTKLFESGFESGFKNKFENDTASERKERGTQDSSQMSNNEVKEQLAKIFEKSFEAALKKKSEKSADEADSDTNS